MGRPPLPEESRRTKRLELRVSDSELRVLERAAAEAGVSVARFIREAALERGISP